MQKSMPPTERLQPVGLTGQAAADTVAALQDAAGAISKAVEVVEKKSPHNLERFRISAGFALAYLYDNLIEPILEEDPSAWPPLAHLFPSRTSGREPPPSREPRKRTKRRTRRRSAKSHRD